MKKRSKTTPFEKMPENQQKINTKNKVHSAHKKATRKSATKENTKHNKHRKVMLHDYMIIEGEVYEANTKTTRLQVNQYVRNFRSEAMKLEKFCAEGGKNSQKKGQRKETITPEIKMEDYVQGLTFEQKRSLMMKLEKQIDVSRNERQKQQKMDSSEYKLDLLNCKLQNLKNELISKKEVKIKETNQLFYEGDISATERTEKIKNIGKVLEKKLKIIQCTKKLFTTIMDSNYEQEFLKGRQIEAAILKDLDSLSDLEHSPQKKKYISGAVVESPLRLNSQNSFKIELGFEEIRAGLSQHHKQVEVSESEGKVIEQPLLISPDKKQFDFNLQKFECVEESVKKLKIPILLTKEKVEQMQWQKKGKAIQRMKSEIDKKVAFQMSEFQHEQFENHFTTLADINGFIVGLYEFIMKSDLDRVVERLNFPYGKSVRDKLYLLQQNGDVDETEYYPVLDESCLTEFNKLVEQTIKNISDGEKIHNRAVFDSFNTHLNAYRPYYQLEGEVYPWSISEKGITFYEINDENIEEVFEKTKIKVLEFASCLCGIIVSQSDANQYLQILKDKNQELFIKEEKLAIIEEFPKWEVKITNYDVMVRFLITEEILLQEIALAAKQINSL